MNKAALEIYRVLKPKGPFVMLVNIEEYIGKRNSSCQNGKVGKTYKPCDEIMVTYSKEEYECIELI